MYQASVGIDFVAVGMAGVIGKVAWVFAGKLVLDTAGQVAWVFAGKVELDTAGGRAVSDHTEQVQVELDPEVQVELDPDAEKAEHSVMKKSTTTNN